MAKRTPVPFNTPVSRFVGGSLYQGSTKDDKGQPRLYKTGPNAGQPRTDYSFGIAIPKTQPHWGTEPGWGAAIWAEGHAAWPAGQTQRPDFAWKIIDGDSTMPNKKMKKPCDQAGYPGHWVLWFSGTTPPRLATAIGNASPTWNDTPGFCNPGDYIEVRGSVSSNESDQTAGMYLNVDAVCMRGFGERIASTGVDLAGAGFGAAPLPVGASATPVGQAMPPAPVPMPATPAAAPQPPAPVVVVPNPAVLGVPVPPAAPPVPVPLPSKVMTTKAAGATYESFAAAGWTDAAMIEQGYLAA
jgi:hypothetical protein